MRYLRLVLCVTVVMGLAAMVGAQGVQTGSIYGSVVDNNGEALAGVTITASSPTLQGTKTTVSDADGAFRFPMLPVGNEYKLTLQLEGFDVEERSGIPVQVGNSTQIVATLSLSTFGEVIEVTADRVVVDTTKVAIDYTVQFEELDKLANNRWYQDVMSMAPGVQDANNPYVQGSSGSANLYLVDGVDTSDPRVQTWGKALNFDSIQEIQVKTAGHEAEYGRAPGGIINLVTKSGGNEFHGTFRWVESREAWGSDWEEGKSGSGRTEESRPIVTLGGPFIKDKLWFFAGYEKRDNSRGYNYYATPEDKDTNNLSSGRTSYAGNYTNAKVTLQATPSHMFAAYYNQDPITLSPLQRGWYGDSYHVDTEREQFQGGWDGSVQWTGVFSDAFFMSSKLQIHRQELNVDPDSPTWNQQPYQYDYIWAYYYGAPSTSYGSERFRDALLVDGTYFLDTASGSHEFKAGIDIQRSKPKAGTLHNDMGYVYTWDGEPFRKYQWFDQLGPTENDIDYDAIFVQDEWRLGKWTLSLGLRAESAATFSNQNQEVVSFGFGDMIAPRLGFAYDLNGNSIHASVGRFYYELNPYLGLYLNESDEYRDYWTWGGNCDVEPGNTWDYPLDCWNFQYRIPIGAGAYRFDPNLEPSYQDVVTVGYRQRINAQMAAGITFVWREQKNQIDVYDPTFSGDYYVTNVPVAGDFEGSPKFSEYSAVMVDFEKRFSSDRISILANYTYSFKQKTWSANWYRDIGDWIFTDPTSIDINWYGRSESPHLFKFFGSYVCPWNMVVGVNFTYTSGNVGTPFIASDYPTNTPLQERGSYRYGSRNWTDLYIEQSFKFGNRFSVGVYANIFRLFNQQLVINRQMNSASGSFEEPTEWQSPRAYQLGFKFEF